MRARTRALWCRCLLYALVWWVTHFFRVRALSEVASKSDAFRTRRLPQGDAISLRHCTNHHLSLFARGGPETPLTPRLCVFPSRARVRRTEKRLYLCRRLPVSSWRSSDWPCAQSVHLLLSQSEHSCVRLHDLTHHCGTSHHSE